MYLFWKIMLAGWLLASAVRANVPATQPAGATLFNGRIEYTPPEGWETVKSPQTSQMLALYIASDHDGYFAIQVLPENAMITPAAAEKIAQQLRTNHKRAGQEIVAEPTIEKDARFAIKIHERYKTREGKIADETHLYRQVAGRAMELDVQSLSDDSQRVAAVQKAGEEVLLSARWKGTPPKKR